MNKVHLIGRLTRDPEVRYTQSNTIYTRFTLAVRRRFVAQDGVDADFINCIAWGKTAEFVSMYIKKGTQIAISGRIQTGSYDAQDGTKRYTTDIVAEEVEFTESKKDGEPNQSNGSKNTPKQQEPVEEVDFANLNSDEFKIELDGTEDDLTFVE